MGEEAQVLTRENYCLLKNVSLQRPGAYFFSPLQVISSNMNEQLKQTLLNMAKLDEQTRTRLARDGSLFLGYHPEMEAVHNVNADALADIIVLHAIGKPDFQKKCLNILKQVVPATSPKFIAYLEDRTRVFEGKKPIIWNKSRLGYRGKIESNSR